MDTFFNQDTLNCPKGVRNRGVPLYYNNVIVPLLLSKSIHPTVMNTSSMFNQES